MGKLMQSMVFGASSAASSVANCAQNDASSLRTCLYTRRFPHCYIDPPLLPLARPLRAASGGRSLLHLVPERIAESPAQQRPHVQLHRVQSGKRRQVLQRRALRRFVEDGVVDVENGGGDLGGVVAAAVILRAQTLLREGVEVVGQVGRAAVVEEQLRLG